MTIEENLALAYLRTAKHQHAYFSRTSKADWKLFREQLADLPAPLEPTTVAKSPGARWRSTPSSAFFSLTVPGLKVLAMPFSGFLGWPLAPASTASSSPWPWRPTCPPSALSWCEGIGQAQPHGDGKGGVDGGGPDHVGITFKPEYRRSRELGRLFQDPMKGTAPHMTIEENLALAYGRG